MNSLIYAIFAVILAKWGTASDITKIAFGPGKDGIVAAFGDFNSDELTDIFMLRNNSHNLEIFLTKSDGDSLLTNGPKCVYSKQITSVLPGDFDGDAYMDVLVTAKGENDILEVYINWAFSYHLNCSLTNEKPLIKMLGEPLAIDYNNDMIIDLFGLNEEGKRIYWIFNEHREFRQLEVSSPSKTVLAVPHANAYLDLNNDFIADMFLQTKNSSGIFFEIWTGQNEGFRYKKVIGMPIGNFNLLVGQSIFLDVELKGKLRQVLPICFDKNCAHSTISVFSGHSYHDLGVNFKDPQGRDWGFVTPKPDDPYLKAITLRAGDFNMDGYPDLLVTLNLLSAKDNVQTFLLENVPCISLCKSLSRTFKVKWNALAPVGNRTVAGTFFDFYQDGVLDLILIEKSGNNYIPHALRNTLDYDANFVKVIVLSGLTSITNETIGFGRRKRMYSTNVPGPAIIYVTTTQEGNAQHGCSAQIPQSAYFALQLPYTIFGLGRTPNFVDSLTIGLGNRSKIWTQIIPNSQIIVVPKPITNPQRWKAQLFVTPSKLIWNSVGALAGICLIILAIVLILCIKEKREDRQERQQEAHRFHFDAM